MLETQEQMAEQPDAFGSIQKQTEGTLAKQESPSKTRCSVEITGRILEAGKEEWRRRIGGKKNNNSNAVSRLELLMHSV